MPGAKKGGRGDMVLESRHLFGLFVLLAVLFGVVFTLGYLLGKGQGDSQAHVAAIRADDSVDLPVNQPPDAPAASTPSNDQKPSAPAASSGTDWSFYHSSDSKPASDTLQPAPAPKPTKPAKTPASSSPPAAATAASKPAPNVPAAKPVAKPATPPKSKAAVGSPLIPKGAIVLQVAALEKQSDALAIAQALQQRKFPAFVLPAGADKYFRVQVGPYANEQAAAAAQKQLESAGFKSIVKR
jgi:cell division septation protein DedD